MRVDQASDVLAELRALSEEHDRITDAVWTHMIRVAAIEYRQEILLDRLTAIRHGVPVPQ
jgi:antirestriction protein